IFHFTVLSSFYSSFLLLFLRPLTSSLFPYTTLFRSAAFHRPANWSSLDRLYCDESLVFHQYIPQSRYRHIYLRARDEALLNEYRSEEHTSELQSRFDLVCRLLLEKKKKSDYTHVLST